MKPGDFQNNLHSPKKKNEFETKIIPFEKREKKARLSQEQGSGAQVIEFPEHYEKINSIKNRMSPFRETFGRCGGVFGVIILLLILALLLAF